MFMKKFFYLALAGTMLLAAAACQTEIQPQGSEDGVKEITTQFVLNVTAAPKTKMTADVVQQNNNFRGIQDGVIFTYKTGKAPNSTPYVLDPSVAADKTFEFPFFFAADALNNTGNNNQTGDEATASKRVLQLSIPVGTDAVLFYGKAIKASGVSDSDYGASKAVTNISATPQNTVIASQPILNETNKTKYDRTGALMIYMINDLLSTSVSAMNTPGTIGTYHYESLPALSWPQLGHQYEIDNYSGTTNRYQASQGVGHKVEGLEEVLGKCYYLFTYLTPSDVPDGITFGSDEWKAWVVANPTLRHHEEYRAGSSDALKRMVIDMYKIVNAAKESEATNDNEANAKRLAQLLINNSAKYFDMENGNFKEISEIKTMMTGTSAQTTEWNNKFEGAQDLNEYPFGDFGIPEGAAQIGFHPEDGTNYLSDQFYYKDPNQPLVNPTMETFEPRKYMYPAELWYYVNSPIRTSTDGNITAASYPDGVNKWNLDASWTGWQSPGAVASATRAVAVTNSINYGVALLKTNVSYSTGNLYDNRKAMTDENSDREIPISMANLQLRGVLVGGQNPRMNWQFVRKYTDGTGDPEGTGDSYAVFDGVVYDHSLSGSKVNGVDVPLAIPYASGNKATTYTLVYDNYNSSESAANQNDVYVALEFVNGGEAFWGRDNLIPKDGVFYLVGKLHKPNADDINGITWPTDHQIPPVDANGVSEQVARVFIQDFMTTANFKIGAKSLQNAYYSVPDLRASQMSLGLSVDLKWETGITYEVNL